MARHSVALAVIAVLVLGIVVPVVLMNTGGRKGHVQEIHTGLRPAMVTTQP
jgi:hypothetical protein